MTSEPPALSAVSFHGRDVLFVHWPAAPSRLAPLVPDGLEIATFEGDAWLGVLAHEVEIRAGGRRLAGPFPQLNVRTYVHHEGEPGVYFLGLLTGSRLGGVIGKGLFDLPIARGQLSLSRGDRVTFRSRGRAGGRALRFDARYGQPGGTSTPAEGSLESFLVERNRYFAQDGELSVGEITREPWQLAPVEAVIRACSLPAVSDPGAAVSRYSPGYEMRLSRLEPA